MARNAVSWKSFWNTDSERFAAWKYPKYGKTSLLSPDDDIWGLACSKDRNTDAVSCTLIPKLSAEFIYCAKTCLTYSGYISDFIAVGLNTIFIGELFITMLDHIMCIFHLAKTGI